MQAQKQLSMPEISEQRLQLREGLVAALGWKGVTLEELPADASFRRYYRLKGAPSPMLLMQDPPDRPPVPPFVMVEPFVKIADHLRGLGLHAPQIFARDIANGLLVIEDFGDDTYTRLLNRGLDAKPLYELAIDVLSTLHKKHVNGAIDLPVYDAATLCDGAMLLVDWYYAALTGKQPTEQMRQSYKDIFIDLFAKLPADQQTLVLRDYHVDNLMLCKDGSCGLLDFQDGATGQFSYDLMSLLEDARRDVPQELQNQMIERYLTAMGNIDRKAFDYSYRVLAAQRHARVLGVFVRLFVRDGKERYLQWIPHVHKLFMKALGQPELAPLKAWFEANNFDISKPLQIKK